MGRRFVWIKQYGVENFASRKGRAWFTSEVARDEALACERLRAEGLGLDSAAVKSIRAVERRVKRYTEYLASNGEWLPIVDSPGGEEHR